MTLDDPKIKSIAKKLAINPNLPFINKQTNRNTSIMFSLELCYSTYSLKSRKNSLTYRNQMMQ